VGPDYLKDDAEHQHGGERDRPEVGADLDNRTPR
jgi:hypothetical protein